jgi:predicted aspartyl protease
MKTVSIKILISGILFLLYITAKTAETKPLVRIPFTSTGAHTYIKARINNSEKEYCFVFDTGAGSTVLDKQILKEVDVEIAPEKEKMETSVNVVETDISLNNNISVNGFNLSGVKLYIEDLSRLNTGPNGEKIAGAIGFELLKNYVSFINYQDNYIELYAPGTTIYSNAEVLPIFLYEDQLPAFRATITTESGQALPVNLIFDSGAGFTASLSSNFIKKHSLEQNLKTKVQVPVIGGAASSASFNYLSSLSQLNIGSFQFAQVPVNFSTSTSGAMSQETIDGVIGMDLVKRFNVVFDHTNKTMKLIANENIDVPFNFNLTGLSFRTKDNQIVISNVMNDSPAAKAGINAGDIVVSVDEKEFGGVDAVKNYLASSYSKKNFQLKRNGETMVVTVQPQKFY